MNWFQSWDISTISCTVQKCSNKRKNGVDRSIVFLLKQFLHACGTRKFFGLSCFLRKCKVSSKPWDRKLFLMRRKKIIAPIQKVGYTGWHHFSPIICLSKKNFNIRHREIATVYWCSFFEFPGWRSCRGLSVNKDKRSAYHLEFDSSSRDNTFPFLFRLQRSGVGPKAFSFARVYLSCSFPRALRRRATDAHTMRLLHLYRGLFELVQL